MAIRFSVTYDLPWEKGHFPNPLRKEHEGRGMDKTTEGQVRKTRYLLE